MAENSEVVIKISGDIKSYQDALKQAESKTQDLNSALESIGKTAGIAFAGLVAGVGFSVKAFAESEEASKRLENALQNQGIYSKDLVETYKKQAESLQTLTGIDDDAIVSAIAATTAMTGQKNISEDLTKSILDLAAGKDIDLQSSAELISKGINGQTAGLQKLGLVIGEHATAQERQAAIIDLVKKKWGDLSKAQNEGLGSIKGLISAAGNLAESIGGQFEPVITRAIKSLTSFFTEINKHPELLNLAAALVAGATAFTGIVAASSAAVIGFLKVKAAMEAASVATGVMKLGIKGLIGATGIGLLVVALTEVYQHWDYVWPRMSALLNVFIKDAVRLLEGFGGIFTGIFITHSMSDIKVGFDKMKAIFSNSLDEYSTLRDKNIKEVEAKEKEAEQNKLDRNKEVVTKMSQDEIEAKKKAIDDIKKQVADLEKEYEFGGETELQKAKEKEEKGLKILDDALAKKVINLNEYTAIRVKVEAETDKKIAEESEKQNKEALEKKKQDFENFVKEINEVLNQITKNLSLVFNMRDAQKELDKLVANVPVTIEEMQTEGAATIDKFQQESVKTLNELQQKNAETITDFQSEIDKTLSDLTQSMIEDGATQEEIDAAVAEKRAELETDLQELKLDQEEELLEKKSDLENEILDKKNEIELGILDEKKALEEEITKKAEENKKQAQEAATSMIAGASSAVADVFIPGFGGAVGEMVTLLAQGGDGLKNAFMAIVDQVPVILANIGTAVTGILEGIIANVDKIVIGILDGVVTMVETIVDRAPEIIDALIDKIPELIEKLSDKLPELISKLSAAMPEIATALSEELIKNAPAIAMALAKSAVEQMVNNFISGIEIFINGLIDVINYIPFVELDHVSLPRLKLAEGGEVKGGVAGMDSVAASLMPGELVVPTRSFEEVINSVRASRGLEQNYNGNGGKILIGFDGREASQVLTARQIEDRALGLTQEVTV